MNVVLSTYGLGTIAFDAQHIQRFCSTSEGTELTVRDIRNLLNDHSTKFVKPVLACLKDGKTALCIDELISIQQVPDQQLFSLPIFLTKKVSSYLDSSVLLDQDGSLVLMFKTHSALAYQEDSNGPI